MVVEPSQVVERKTKSRRVMVRHAEPTLQEEDIIAHVPHFRGSTLTVCDDGCFDDMGLRHHLEAYLANASPQMKDAMNFFSVGTVYNQPPAPHTSPRNSPLYIPVSDALSTLSGFGYPQLSSGSIFMLPTAFQLPIGDRLDSDLSETYDYSRLDMCCLNPPMLNHDYPCFTSASHDMAMQSMHDRTFDNNSMFQEHPLYEMSLRNTSYLPEDPHQHENLQRKHSR